MDARAFEKTVQEAEQDDLDPLISPKIDVARDRVGVRNVQNKSGIVQRLEKATSLYKGHFLCGDGDKPWAVSMRERLRSKYLRAVARLGGIHEQEGRYAKAVEVYERGLEVDDLAEEFYRRLMECFRRMGRRAEAVRVYERCRKTHRTALRVEPGSQIEALYRKITG